MSSNEFYLLNDIQKLISCTHCEKRLDVPKIIPCGKTICTKCESDYLKSRDRLCKSCFAVHEVPKNGFPKNESVVQLLKLSPAKVYRGEVHKKTVDMVNEISLLNKNLQDQMQNAYYVVSDYCDMLRSCVDIKTESEIAQLNNHRDFLLSKINRYEEKCNDKSSLLSSYAFSECENQCEKWGKLLNRESTSDKDTCAVQKEVIKQMDNLVDMRNDFEKSIFGPRKLVFYENTTQTSTPSSLGTITERINQKLKMQLYYRTEQASAYCNPILIKINDRTMCMAVSLHTNTTGYPHLKLAIITDDVVIKEVKEPMYQGYNNYTAIKCKDHIVVHFYSNAAKAEFRIYDLNLKLIKSLNSNYLFSMLLTNENRIFGYSCNNAIWAVFDGNLKLLESIGIGDSSTYPFIMSNRHAQIELKYGCLFSYCKRELKVVDNEKRALLACLTLDEKTFPNPTFVRPCSSDVFYVVDSASKTIQSFDFHLNCLHKFKVNDIAKIDSISLTSDGDIVLYDYTTTTAYLF